MDTQITEYILEVNGLSRRFSGFSLDDVSFSLPAGSIMGLIGENGAGKTTTLKLILNLLRPDSGDVRVFGLSVKEHEREIKQKMGVVFENVHFSDILTPEDLKSILAGMYTDWDGELYKKYLREFSVPDRKKIGDCSKGTRMKLSVAAALSHRPRLLLLDEATSGLDPVARHEMLDILLDFIQNEECGILLSSHITSDLEKAADYITLLHGGRVVLSEDKDTLLYDYGILKCGAADAARVDPQDVLKKRVGSYGCEILVRGRKKIAARYPSLTLDSLSLDELMLFYSGREEK